MGCDTQVYFNRDTDVTKPKYNVKQDKQIQNYQILTEVQTDQIIQLMDLIPNSTKETSPQFKSYAMLFSPITSIKLKKTKSQLHYKQLLDQTQLNESDKQLMLKILACKDDSILLEEKLNIFFNRYDVTYILFIVQNLYKVRLTWLSQLIINWHDQILLKNKICSSDINIQKLVLMYNQDDLLSDQFDYGQVTPLMIATCKNNLSLCVKNLNVIRKQTHNGLSALMLAVQCKSYNCIDILLEEIGLLDQQGKSALILAIECEDIYAYRTLIQKEGNICDWQKYAVQAISLQMCGCVAQKSIQDVQLTTSQYEADANRISPDQNKANKSPPPVNKNKNNNYQKNKSPTMKQQNTDKQHHTQHNNQKSSYNNDQLGQNSFQRKNKIKLMLSKLNDALPFLSKQYIKDMETIIIEKDHDDIIQQAYQNLQKEQLEQNQVEQIVSFLGEHEYYSLLYFYVNLSKNQFKNNQNLPIQYFDNGSTEQSTQLMQMIVQENISNIKQIINENPEQLEIYTQKTKINPLILAVIVGNTKILQLLIQQSVELTQKRDINDKNALAYAIEKEDYQCYKILLQYEEDQIYVNYYLSQCTKYFKKLASFNELDVAIQNM